jgi:hypothetical protein
MNWRRGILRLWIAASALWVFLIIGVVFGPKMIGPNPAFNVRLTATSIPEASRSRIKINSDTGEMIYLDESSNEWKPAKTAVNPQTHELVIFDGKEWVAVTVQGPGITRRIDKALQEITEREPQLHISFFKSELLSVSFWTLLLGPPAGAGILMFLISWVIAGFRLRQST